MRKLKGVIKGGLSVGLALSLMMSAAACGKTEVVVDDYAGDSAVSSSFSDDTVSDDTADASQSDSQNAESKSGSLKDIYGDKISYIDTLGLGGVSVDYYIDYTVPEVEQVNVYDCSFLENDSDVETQIVSSFFGGTEKNLDEIRYVDDTEYMQLLYKYRALLGSLTTDADSTSEEDYEDTIDSSFDQVYKWADEESYYIHMYEGEYNGNRYGMIYSFSKINLKRNIFISPISIADYFPNEDAETIIVVDQQDDYGSDNRCTMSETEVMSDATGILEKLGLSKEDTILSVNPNMATPETGSLGYFNYSDNWGAERTYTEMPKLVFADTDLLSAVMKINSTNPAGSTYAYRLLNEQPSYESNQSFTNDVNFTENGYAVYLTAKPFAENVIPEEQSTFNRGSIFYTDKGLFSVDISLVAGLDGVEENVELLPFEEIVEHFNEALENDPQISGKSSGSLNVLSASFTYVLIDVDEANKAKYVPAWYFTTKDNQLKNGSEPVIYTHVLNAMDGSDLTSEIK